MNRWVLAFVFALPLSGCGDLTPCETELNCVIACECDNGGAGFGSGYRCVSGTCRDGHKDDRDCERLCTNIRPPTGSPGDDDSALGDDDSGRAQ